MATHHRKCAPAPPQRALAALSISVPDHSRPLLEEGAEVGGARACAWAVCRQCTARAWAASRAVAVMLMLRAGGLLGCHPMATA